MIELEMYDVDDDNEEQNLNLEVEVYRWILNQSCTFVFHLNTTYHPP